MTPLYTVHCAFFSNIKKLETLKNVKPSNFLQLTKICRNCHDDFWDQTREYQIRNQFNVYVAVIDKTNV